MKLAAADDGRRTFSLGDVAHGVLLLRGEKPPLRQTINAAGLVYCCRRWVTVWQAEHQNVRHQALLPSSPLSRYLRCALATLVLKRKLEWVGDCLQSLPGIILPNSGGNLSGNPWARFDPDRSDEPSIWFRLRPRIALPVGMMAGDWKCWRRRVAACAAFSFRRKARHAAGLISLWPSATRRCSVLIIAIMPICTWIRNVSPALATSYAYVNPVVAVLLVAPARVAKVIAVEWAALGVIVFAVVLVTLVKVPVSCPGGGHAVCKTEDSRQ